MVQTLKGEKLKALTFVQEVIDITYIWARFLKVKKRKKRIKARECMGPLLSATACTQWNHEYASKADGPV